MSNELNSYELSRAWFDFCFENPEQIRPIHTAVFMFAIEHCNRLGWKEKFGFPSNMVMETIGVRNWKTYSKALNDLVEWGFIKMIEISKNQYSSNKIALVKNTKAHAKALDKALSKHNHKQGTKQGTKQGQSIVSIDKQPNKEQGTIEQTNIVTPAPFVFKTSLLNYGLEKQLVEDWLKIRKNKKATNTQTAYNSFIEQIGKTGREKNEVFKIVVESGWSGFKVDWLNKDKKKDSTGRRQAEPIVDFKYGKNEH